MSYKCHSLMGEIWSDRMWGDHQRLHQKTGSKTGASLRRRRLGWPKKYGQIWDFRKKITLVITRDAERRSRSKRHVYRRASIPFRSRRSVCEGIQLGKGLMAQSVEPAPSCIPY